MARTEAFCGLCQLWIAWMVWNDAIAWGVLGLLFSLKGAANALFLPASAGVVPSIVNADGLTQANATLRLSMNVVRIGGAGMASLIAVAVGAHAVLWADAATFLISGFALATVKWPPTPARTTHSNLRVDLSTGWREFFSRRWVLIPVVQMTYINAAISAFMSVLGPAASRSAGWGLPGWSALVTAHTVGLVAGSILAMRIQFRHPIRWAVLIAGFEALPLLLLGAHSPLVLCMAGMFVTAVLMDIYGVTWDATIQRGVPEEALSRVSSYDMLASFSGAPLGVALVGVLLAVSTPENIMLWAAGGILATAPLALTFASVRNFTLDHQVRITSS